MYLNPHPGPWDQRVILLLCRRIRRRSLHNFAMRPSIERATLLGSLSTSGRLPSTFRELGHAWVQWTERPLAKDDVSAFMSRNWRSGILYGHWERKLMVVCLKLFGLDCSTTRPCLSGIASKDLDPTGTSHCVYLNALFFACYANTCSHRDSDNHRFPKSHFRRHNDRTQ